MDQKQIQPRTTNTIVNYFLLDYCFSTSLSMVSLCGSLITNFMPHSSARYGFVYQSTSQTFKFDQKSRFSKISVENCPASHLKRFFKQLDLKIRKI